MAIVDHENVIGTENGIALKKLIFWFGKVD